MKFGMLYLEGAFSKIKLVTPWVINNALFIRTPKDLKPKPKKVILIIDNEPNMLNLLYSVLSPQYQLKLIKSPVDAVTWIEEGNKPSLVITEFNQYQFSGAHFISYLKASGFYSAIPIVILSAIVDLEIKATSCLSDVAAVISKPFDPVYLKSQINLIINEHESAAIA